MRREKNLTRDTWAAATEIGYVLTFLLGLSFMSFFSVWTWEMQDARGDVWMEQAIEENLDSVAAAIERAEVVSRFDGNATYAEPVEMLLSNAVNLHFRMVLTDDSLLMQDHTANLKSTRDISSTGNSH
ncbi:MAG TPA: hypothetical protein QF433_02055, partial [Candidatus Thalassarchaeaceae archaeon]|nr:hypothetical protein [Candidatus Thalassarchaeaceae archaeon]